MSVVLLEAATAEAEKKEEPRTQRMFKLEVICFTLNQFDGRSISRSATHSKVSLEKKKSGITLKRRTLGTRRVRTETERKYCACFRYNMTLIKIADYEMT